MPAAGQLSLALQLLLAFAQEAASELVGCFHHGYAYSYFKPNVSVSREKVAGCQAHCAETSGCKAFTFWESRKRCDVAGDDALLQVRDSAVSGLAQCTGGWNPVTPQCVEQPAGSFPDATASKSAAAWPSGVVPTNLQCWPKPADSSEPDHCSHTTVVEDIETTGWHGACSGLMQVSVHPGETCEQVCRDNMFCSVWQEHNNTKPPQCLHGAMGVSCQDSFDPSASRGQRIMHGTYRVLKKLAGIQIYGLTKMFPAAAFDDWKVAAAHCRFNCIAALTCQFWTYSKVYGCWAENSLKFRVKYPLTQKNAKRATAFAATVVAGEYIQHLCDMGDPEAGHHAVSELAAAVKSHKKELAAVVDAHKKEVIAAAEAHKKEVAAAAKAARTVDEKESVAPGTIPGKTFAQRPMEEAENALAPGTIAGKTWDRPDGPLEPTPSDNFPLWARCLVGVVVAVCCFGAIGAAAMRLSRGKGKTKTRTAPASDEKPLLSAGREGQSSDGSGSDG